MDIRVDLTIVGAGVIGCAVAWELARQGREVVVLEKNQGVTRGENQSSRNSGVIHAGLYYDPESMPLKAGLCAKGNRLLHEFCRRYAIPALQTGKLIVATRDQEVPTLEFYHRRAGLNGVPSRLLSAAEALEMEPRVASRGALFLPTSGIIDATSLVHQLYALASAEGAQFLTQTELNSVRPGREGLELEIEYRDGARDRFLTGLMINSAGLHCDEVATMVDPGSPYRVDPLRSEAMKFYRGKRPELGLAGHNVYPTPQRIETPSGSYFSVGVHLTPTLDSGPGGSIQLGPVVTVGPLGFPAKNKHDLAGEFRPPSVFLERVGGFFPGLREDDLEPHQTGIQARLAGHKDWVIEFSPNQPRCLNLLGMDSPGLTSSLAIAGHVAAVLGSQPRLDQDLECQQWKN